MDKLYTVKQQGKWCRLFQFFVDGWHKFADLYSLRAFFVAFAALDADACLLAFREETIVDEPRSCHIVIDYTVIVEFKDPGNVNALGAWQAVTALCAGDSGAFQEHCADALDQFHVLR